MAMFGQILIFALRYGYFVGRWGGRTYRNKQPIAYWLLVVFVSGYLLNLLSHALLVEGQPFSANSTLQ